MSLHTITGFVGCAMSITLIVAALLPETYAKSPLTLVRYAPLSALLVIVLTTVGFDGLEMSTTVNSGPLPWSAT